MQLHIATSPVIDTWGDTIGARGSAWAQYEGRGYQEIKETSLGYLYNYISEDVTFRPPTPEEEAKLLAIIETSPIHSLIPFRGRHSIGTDPEIFVMGGKSGKKLIPAFEFLPSKEGRDIYWDGFQAEFRTTAQVCLAYLLDSIQSRLGDLLRAARKHDPTACLDATPLVKIPKEMMEQASEEYVALGCLPSKNAYGDSGMVVENGRALPVRVAGCHIHIELDSQARNESKDIIPQIKMADAIAGILSVSVLEGLEHPRRRELYGLAGEYRTPAHGLEYRTLSSAILWHPALLSLMGDFVRVGCSIAKAGLQHRWKASEEEVRHTINTLDVTLAREILSRNRKFVEECLWGLYCNEKRGDNYSCEPYDVPSPSRIFDEFVMVGAKKYISLDVEANWHLSDGKWISHGEGPEVMVWRSLKKWLDGTDSPMKSRSV